MFRLTKIDISTIRSLENSEDAYQYYLRKEKEYQDAQRYNGWVGEEHNRISARFTWHLMLVLDPTDDEYLLEYIKEEYNKDDTYQIGNYLKEYYEEIVYQDAVDGGDIRNQRLEGGYHNKTTGRNRLNMAADSAISDMLDWVNWPLIAEHVVEAIEWEEEDATSEAVAVGLHGGESEDEPEADTED